MLVDLHAQGLKIRHLRNFGSRHAVGVLRNWEKLGLKSSTLSTYVSHLRTFVTWIGKAELVPVIDRFCADRPGFTHRRTATEKDKSARGAAVEPAEILRRARQTGDQHFVCQLLLVMSLGLRARESWRFRPHLADRPGYLLITEGTKGGRPRTLPAPSTATQSAVLERAKALVPYGASMIPAHYRRVAQWASRFYKLCRQIGLTREGLGVTTHSLRHDVLLDLFAEIAGEPAPVRREGDSQANSHRVQVAREVVAQHAGHSRTSVTSAYLGSRRRNPRGQRSQGAEELPSPRSVKIAVSSPDTVSSEPERSEVTAQVCDDENDAPEE